MLQPLLSESGSHGLENFLDAKSLLAMAKIYQEHLHQSAESVSVEQTQITSRLKEVRALLPPLPA